MVRILKGIVMECVSVKGADDQFIRRASSSGFDYRI